MQPQRSIGGITQADLMAIAEHDGLSKRQTRAKQLWRELLAMAGGLSCKLQINEAQMAALIGGGKLWRSKDSEGPLEALIRVRAVEKAEPGWWFIRTPGDAVKPRQALIETDAQPLLIPDAGDDQAEAPPQPPSVLRLRRSPPDSEETNGGKGGRCAPDSLHSKKQEQENTSCSYSSKQSDSGRSPTVWKTVRHRLAALGAYGPSKIVARIREVGGRPYDLMKLCDYFENNPDGLKINGGALHDACYEWLPEMAYDAPGIWPQVKLPTITTAGEKSARQLAEEYEHERNLLFRKLERLGADRKQINIVLTREGFEPVAVLENHE